MSACVCVADPLFNHSGACQFRFSSELGKNEIYRATLGVYVRRTATTAWNTYLLIYAVVERSPQVRQMIGRRPIRLRPGTMKGWHTFKITREVRAWIENPASNNGLIIEATDDRGVPIVVVQTNRPEDESFVSLAIATAFASICWTDFTATRTALRLFFSVSVFFLVFSYRFSFRFRFSVLGLLYLP